MILSDDKDPIGSALIEYLNTADDTPINVKLDVAEDDVLSPSYFFRSFDDCPELEQVALHEAKGKVLDVGAGAGSHSLYLQKQGLEVTAIDVSPNSVDVMQQRGIKNVELIDFYDYQGDSFDTMLLLMNGIGLVQTLDGFDQFFTHARTLLSPNGQILLDSSDLIYMFEEEDGSYLIDMNDKYHGEVEFNLSYKDIKGEPFNWLYVAEELLQDAAEANDFNCEIIKQGPHYDYLAKLTVREE
ncbi:MAG: SAM-dependent methyltransferase [Piscirickettsiaceae bacterium]|nr:MAG: SAM-dependent methyltransferase [Piscirickettsiaceae bacterium]PCI71812.1 MAG: SAM-dependent methyltransferase [Piscirickettsiaceae bacterium]